MFTINTTIKMVVYINKLITIGLKFDNTIFSQTIGIIRETVCHKLTHSDSWDLRSMYNIF